MKCAADSEPLMKAQAGASNKVHKHIHVTPTVCNVKSYTWSSAPCMCAASAVIAVLVNTQTRGSSSNNYWPSDLRSDVSQICARKCNWSRKHVRVHHQLQENSPSFAGCEKQPRKIRDGITNNLPERPLWAMDAQHMRSV